MCPVCRSPLSLNVPARLPLMTHFRLALFVGGGAYVLSFFVSLEASLKSLVFYFPLWGLAELVHSARWRESLKCGACAFDPQLYHRDWRAARARVEARLGAEQAKLVEAIGERSAKLRQRAPSATAPKEAPLSLGAERGTTRVVSLNDGSDDA